MNYVSSRRLAALLVPLMLSGVTAYAQSDLGSIQGFVKDPSGSSVPNAKVLVHNQAGLERSATTNESGYYTITSIPSGFYSIQVEAPGFKKFESANNKLDASTTLSVDATLTVGAPSETVEVSATAAAVQTESATVQRLVTRDQIDALELNGRNPIFMANLVPGTRGGNLSGLSFNFSQGPSNINGARTQESLITYDGAPAVRTRSNGTSLGAADVDSTQEIQVLTANYAAEYGRSSGGQIRIVLKSGTNQFHGSAGEYVRNAAFNANTWTRNHTPGQNYVPVFNYNNWVYNMSGPFYIPGKFNKEKNKIFWFWGQEWVRYRFTDSNSLAVPSLLMRKGDFSELLNPSNFYYGKVVTIKDPTTGNPFPNNIIPAAQLSKNGLGILNAWPAPNLATPINGNQLWYATAIHPQNQRKDTLKADFNLTDSQRISFSRMNYEFNEYQPLDGGTPYTPKYFYRPNQTNTLSHVWTISPNKVNEVLITASLDDVYIPVDSAHFLDRTSVGINYPYIFPQGKLIQNRIPTVNMTSFSGLSGGPYPSHSTGPIYTLSDSFTWIKGTHTMKFGFSFERSGENDNDEINVSACPTCTNNQNGQFSFTDTRSGQPGTGNAVANAAMGLFDSYSELGQRAYTIFRGSMYEGFAQDSWKVTRKLHIDYGARYTVIVPFKALWGNMIVFDPTLYDPSKAVGVDQKTGTVIMKAGSDRYNGMVIPGSGWPDSAKGRFPEATSGQYDYLFRGGKYDPYYSDIQYGQIQPRVGIAYQLNDKTVLRAGGGRFYTKLGVSDSVFLGGNPPFQPTANVSFGNADNPGGTAANALPLTVTTQSKSFKTPEAFNWNFTVEREVWWNSILTVGYVGRRGLHQQREADINQPTLATVLANPGVNLDALRPYQGYNSIRETDNVANTQYNSLQISWNRRFNKGPQIGVAYTLSKSMDDGSAQRDIIPDTYYAGNLWGQSDFDVRHIFIASYLYELPFFKGNDWKGKALGHWQVSGIVQMQTGTPSSIAVGTDYAGVGLDGSISNAGQFWQVLSTPTVQHQIALNGASDNLYWFNVKDSAGNLIVAPPAKGTFVTQQGIRNLIHNPGFENWNTGLFKSFALKERLQLQFRAEAFNVLNHPNWNGASFNPTNLSTFGKITGKSNDVRNLQLSLRLQF
ncbi:MAG TPA: carboxypeptidase regulatory-like domain-containing protein [Bryobacteraceae bacterium]|jgi:predicted heme/steroid binding protein